MKKLLLLVIASLALFSCEGPMGPQGPQGVPGEGMFWEVLHLYRQITGLETCYYGRRAQHLLHV